VDGEGSREAETQERIGRQARGNSNWCERTRGRSKASKQVKRAEQSRFRRSVSRATGKHGFGHAEREPIAAGGIRLLRVSVGVEETSRDKSRASLLQHARG
jgi:hypothetical protein